ncbi:MAG: PspC domain-containing protein [Flavobacteriales bacterium]
MNKTININLAGFVYNMDENAYDLLKKHLSEIRSFLKSTEGAEEIMCNIEQHIAKLFKTYLKGREVILPIDVEEVIKIMGGASPISAKTNGEQVKYQEAPRHAAYQKKLFRHPEDKHIAGICGGLAVYLEVDAIWIRILAIALPMFFIPFIPILLGYIILWMLVPYPKTTVEKLQMNRESVNFDTIKKTFEKQSAAADSKLRTATNRTIHTLEKIIRHLSRWAIVLLSSCFILGGVTVISLWGLFLFHNIHMNLQSIEDSSFFNFLIYNFDFTPMYYLSILYISLLTLIPTVIVILFGIKFLNRTFRLKRSFMTELLILWCVAIAASIIYGIYINQFSYDTSSKKTIRLNASQNEWNIIFNKFLIK